MLPSRVFSLTVVWMVEPLAGVTVRVPSEATVVVYVDPNGNAKVPAMVGGVRTTVIPASAQAVSMGTAPQSLLEAGVVVSLPATALRQAVSVKQQMAQSLMKAPPGQLVEANAYYAFSSVFFYTGRTALLLNGRNNNLEYGSYAPGAPNVFIDDAKFAALWQAHSRCYLLAYGSEKNHLEQLIGPGNLHVVAEKAGNYLFTNFPIP